jgi:hypothetical protein
MVRYIKESDIYKLFEESNGIVKLHVAQIDELPRANVVEAKHGEWEYEKINGTIYCSCSECGESPDCFELRYCPNCGAKMGGKKEVN